MKELKFSRNQLRIFEINVESENWSAPRISEKNRTGFTDTGLLTVTIRLNVKMDITVRVHLDEDTVSIFNLKLTAMYHVKLFSKTN